MKINQPIAWTFPYLLGSLPTNKVELKGKSNTTQSIAIPNHLSIWTHDTMKSIDILTADVNLDLCFET